MRLLLDTHVFLWWAEDSEKLKREVRRSIEGADEVFVSAASAWEVSINIAAGKLRMRMPVFESVMRSGFSPLPVDFAHAEAVKDLPAVHSDPFDRMLAAQALVEWLQLVSRDRLLAKYPVSFLPA